MYDLCQNCETFQICLIGHPLKYALNQTEQIEPGTRGLDPNTRLCSKTRTCSTDDMSFVTTENMSSVFGRIWPVLGCPIEQIFAKKTLKINLN